LRLLSTAILISSALSTMASAQILPPPEIDAAIEAGRKGEADRMVSRCYATESVFDKIIPDPDVDVYQVAVSLTAGRIAALSAEAKRRYQTLLPKDVPKELRIDAVFVNAVPRDPPPKATHVSRIIQHMVLKSKNGAVVQPDDLKTERVEWANPAGAVSNRAFARFPIGNVRELPAGDFEVILITEGGERHCKVGTKDRERLFGGR